MSLGIVPDILLEEIEKFEENGNCGELPSLLEEYLQFVARTGDPLLPWNRIKSLLKFKLTKVIEEFYDVFGGEELVESANTPPFSYLPTRTKIMQHFDSFAGAPFTIQRLCEILLDPKRYYTRTDKFLRGLEKNIYVVSFIEPGDSKRMLEQHEESMANGLQDMSPPHPSMGGFNDSAKTVDCPVSLADADVEMSEPGNEERMNGNVITNGVGEDGSSSSSSSPSSSTSSSPTPDDDSRDSSGPAPKRARLDLTPEEGVTSQQITPEEGVTSQQITPEEGAPRQITPEDRVSSRQITPEEGVSSRQTTPEEGVSSQQLPPEAAERLCPSRVDESEQSYSQDTSDHESAYPSELGENQSVSDLPSTESIDHLHIESNLKDKDGSEVEPFPPSEGNERNKVSQQSADDMEEFSESSQPESNTETKTSDSHSADEDSVDPVPENMDIDHNEGETDLKPHPSMDAADTDVVESSNNVQNGSDASLKPDFLNTSSSEGSGGSPDSAQDSLHSEVCPTQNNCSEATACVEETPTEDADTQELCYSNTEEDIGGSEADSTCLQSSPSSPPSGGGNAGRGLEECTESNVSTKTIASDPESTLEPTLDSTSTSSSDSPIQVPVQTPPLPLQEALGGNHDDAHDFEHQAQVISTSKDSNQGPSSLSTPGGVQSDHIGQSPCSTSNT